MLKKDITYKDFNGETTTETFYFHLSQADLLRMEVRTKGGLQKALEVMVQAEDGAAIMEFIETFIKESVGRKSPDGRRFEKSATILDDFTSSNAYDALFMELCTNPANAADFLNGIVPAEMAENIEKLSKLDQVKAKVAERHPGEARLAVEKPHDGDVVPLDPDTEITDPSQPLRPRTLTIAEMQEMDDAELRTGLAEGRFVIGKD